MTLGSRIVALFLSSSGIDDDLDAVGDASARQNGPFTDRLRVEERAVELDAADRSSSPRPRVITTWSA
ncbi:hypothetical protein GTZ89_22215 [Streptomyces sp. SID8382]|uniref:hypothetical protein n=1 Tax=Streptomyces malaysiensis TaxID=92644 RepID=UPI000C2C9AD2|nr:MULTISPECIES: hypothetical protein [unclassified Streptomyces]MYX58303.1 hypothetical protein [Streptomyces sp. SID8382]